MAINNINPRFVGVDNYIKMFNDTAIIIAIRNTMIYMMAAIVFQVGLGITFAVIVDMVKTGQRFFKTVYFFPIVISAAALGLMFKLIYSYDAGLLNGFLELMGYEPILWITEKTALLSVLAPAIWQYVGFYFIIILTAITKIPESLYEVSYLEGASNLQRISKITLPLIFSDIKVCLILAITGALRVFGIVWIITQGGPFDSSQVLGTYLYDTVFQSRLYGYGSAIAILIITLGFVVVFLTNRFVKAEEVTIN